MSKEIKTVPRASKLLGLGGLLGKTSKLSQDAQEIVKAIRNNTLTIEGSDDCKRYKIEEEDIIDKTFIPTKKECLFIKHAHKYNIHGHTLAFEALQKISKESEIPNQYFYGEWQDSDIFSEIVYKSPEEAKESIKIIYDIYADKFSFTAPNIENVGHDYNFYETYPYNTLSEAIEKKNSFYDAFNSFYEERIVSTMRYHTTRHLD